jgi:hypothetical protein
MWKVLRLAVYFVAVLLIAEILARSFGITPWKREVADFVVEPGGRLFCKDPALGYANLPGQFKVTFDQAHQIAATHLPGGLRITHPLATYEQGSSKKEIWILGCSFSYGWLVSDEQSFPWLLQEDLPQYEVVNFATAGYSTLQSLLQLKAAVKERRKPAAVVLAYASFQDARNPFLRSIRKRLRLPGGDIGSLSLPYAYLARQGELRYGRITAGYKEPPFARYLAISNWADDSYNQLEDVFFKSHNISKALINEIRNVCAREKINFVVAGLDRERLTVEMLAYCKSQGISVVDMAVDMTRKENVVLPYDSHPSSIANKKYSEKIRSFLAAQKWV